MPILLLVGDNTHTLKQQLAMFKSKLDPVWIEFNYHMFTPSVLPQALASARTLPVGDIQKVVVIENCNFGQVNQFGERQLELLQGLDQISDSTLLVFTAPSIDKRLKIVKQLLKYGKLKELPLIPPWRADLITQAIAAQAKSLKLPLSKECLDYLVLAIGNDSARADSELRKLKTYASGQPLTYKAIKSLIPCQTQTSLQLAEAMRQGDSSRAIALLGELLARLESPLVIVATLITQFRTWLWVKSALTEPARRKDSEIAQRCGIGNPNRLYYLRQDVAKISVKALSQALTLLFQLDTSLKQGASTTVVLPIALQITRLFQSKSLK